MEDYLLRISEKSDKAQALINYIKTLDFVEVTKSTDWWDELSEDNKTSIENGLNDLKNGNTHTDEVARQLVSERILNAKKG